MMMVMLLAQEKIGSLFPPEAETLVCFRMVGVLPALELHTAE
jgi:hypothetical protein